MKIGFLVDKLSIYGAEGVCIRTALESSRDYETYVITLKSHLDIEKNEFPYSNIFTLKTNSGITHSMISVLKLRRFIKNYNLNCMVSFLTLPNVIARFATIGLDCKLLVTEHGFPNPKRKNFLILKLLAIIAYRKKIVYSVSESLDVSLANHFKVNNLRRFPVNIDSIFFKDSNVTLDIDSRIARKKFLFIGRFDDNKQPILAIKLLLSNHFKDWTLTMAGEGPIYNQVKNFVQEFKLLEKVIFLGNVKGSEIVKLIDSHSILIHTSRNEGYGLVLVEAAVRGMPYFTIAKGGPEEFTRGYNCGWFYDVERHSEEFDEFVLVKIIEGLKIGNKNFDNFKASVTWSFIKKELIRDDLD